MVTKKKPGRPKKSNKDKVKMRHIYLTDQQEAKIRGNFDTLTKAILAKWGQL